MTAKERLLKTLFDSPSREHINIKFFRWSVNGVSEDVFCEHVNQALFDIDNDRIDVAAPLQPTTHHVDVRSLSIPSLDS